MVDQTNTEPPQYDWQTPKPQFDVGRVLGRTFSAIKNNLVKFSIVSIIIAGLPMFLIGLWPLFITGGEGILSDSEISEAAVAGTMAASVVGVIVYMFIYIILQSILVLACFKDFAGERVSLRESGSIALKLIFPLVGLSILYFLGVGLGFLLLIIPGIFLLLGWYLAVPILLVEKTGVIDSFSRSWTLTSGYKRWILLIIVILWVISTVISVVLTLLAVPFGDVATATLTGGSTLFWIVYAFASALAQALTVMINASAVAAIYYEIRDLKEGITPMSIASVFD